MQEGVKARLFHVFLPDVGTAIYDPVGSPDHIGWGFGRSDSRSSFAKSVGKRGLEDKLYRYITDYNKNARVAGI